MEYQVGVWEILVVSDVPELSRKFWEVCRNKFRYVSSTSGLVVPTYDQQTNHGFVAYCFPNSFPLFEGIQYVVWLQTRNLRSDDVYVAISGCHIECVLREMFTGVLFVHVITKHLYKTYKNLYKTNKHLYNIYKHIHKTYKNLYKTYKHLYKTCKNIYKTCNNLYKTYKHLYKTCKKHI